MGARFRKKVGELHTTNVFVAAAVLAAAAAASVCSVPLSLANVRALTLNFIPFRSFHSLTFTLINVCASVCLPVFASFFLFCCHHSILTISINCTAVKECIKLNQVSKIERRIPSVRCVCNFFVCLFGLAWLSPNSWWRWWWWLFFCPMKSYCHTTFARAHTNPISGQLCLILFIGYPEHFTWFRISIDIILTGWFGWQCTRCLEIFEFHARISVHVGVFALNWKLAEHLKWLNFEMAQQ